MSEIDRKLNLLTEQWNAVQGAALGRGARALVPDAMAEHVATEHELYAKWRESLGGLMYTSGLSDELKLWTDRVNALAAEVRAALPAEQRARVPGDLAAMDASGALADVGRALQTVVVVIGAGAALALLLRKRS